MKHLMALPIVFFMLLVQPAHAAKIELEFKGVKQVIEFDPTKKTDMDHAWALWRKSDNRKSYIYSETGSFRMYDEPRNNAKVTEIGNWYQELNSRFQQSPELAHLAWDKSKWHPRFPATDGGWLKLDDPYIIWPNQLKPMKQWPIRYIAYYHGTDTAATEAGIKPKYDEYTRWHFDREGFVLDNRTMKRKLYDGNPDRMFYFGDFVHEEAVLANNTEKSADLVGEGDYSGYSLNLRQFMERQKLVYRDSGPVSDRGGGNIFVWATFDDPIKPVYDKFNPKICIVDYKDRKRWTP